MGFLGAREREHLNRQQFLEKITGLLQFDRGLSESIRRALGEVALAFDCDQACLAIRDEDLERLFVWKVRPNERDPIAAETPPLTQSDAFLMDSLEVSMGWQFRNGNGTGSGFGWDRRSGQPFHALPAASKRCARRAEGANPAGGDDRIGRPAGWTRSAGEPEATDSRRRAFDSLSRSCVTSGRHWKIFSCCATCARGQSNRSAAAFHAICTTASCRRF